MFLKQRFFAAEKATAPISIAFLDTGISPVADFTHPENRIVAFLDLVNGRKDPYDDNGHGTHVAERNIIVFASSSAFPVPCKNLLLIRSVHDNRAP